MDSKSSELRQGNISLILDSYNDLFSDFDPRDYDERGVSDDFVAECKNAVRDKKEGFELRLLVPKRKRNRSDEAKIKKRVKEFFQHRFEDQEKELLELRREGSAWFILGACAMFFAAILSTQKGLGFNFLRVLTEPAGWFLMWSGLDKIFIAPSKEKDTHNFYHRMVKAEVNFFSY